MQRHPGFSRVGKLDDEGADCLQQRAVAPCEYILHLLTMAAASTLLPCQISLSVTVVFLFLIILPLGLGPLLARFKLEEGAGGRENTNR